MPPFLSKYSSAHCACIASESASPLRLHNRIGPDGRTGAQPSAGQEGIELGQKEVPDCVTQVL